MAANLGGDSDEGITNINITPFVDIILVVLIIFMVTTSYIVKQAIKVQLPEAATGEGIDSTSLGLMIDAKGTLYLDGEPITDDGLRAALRAERERVATEGGDIVALIAADKVVLHGDVVALIDLVRQEGIARFAINIDPTALPPQAAGAVGVTPEPGP